MNLDRLNRQIQILEEVNAEQKLFAMDAWLRKYFEEDICGTACCAFGYAALDPRFQAEGVTMRAAFNRNPDQTYIYEEVTSIAAFNALVKQHETPPIYAEPGFEGLSGFYAAARFYGIEHQTACYLFDPDEYYDHTDPITPEDVINRIGLVIECKGALPAGHVMHEDYVADNERDNDD